MSRKKSPRSILLLTKTDDNCSLAERLCCDLLENSAVSVHRGNVNTPSPLWPANLTDTWIISYRSPWIVPRAVLNRATVCINFHPGSSDYPGFGCYNFALYEGAPDYGVVCHFMEPKVNSGAIIEERRFPIFPCDSVQSLQRRTLIVLLALFHDVLSLIALGQRLPVSDKKWSRVAFTRKEFSELNEIRPSMSDKEIANRVRAVSYPGFAGPIVRLGGFQFSLC